MPISLVLFFSHSHVIEASELDERPMSDDDHVLYLGSFLQHRLGARGWQGWIISVIRLSQQGFLGRGRVGLERTGCSRAACRTARLAA